MKKVMIRCDIEGVSGVVSYLQAEPGKPEFEFGRNMFMADLMACVDGLLSGGADEIVIYDEHYYGRNIDIGKLPQGGSAICGKPPYRADWAGGLEKSFYGMVLLGFHSKFGTGELLHHSYELDIRDIRLNGLSVGEIGNEAAIAGDWGVPLMLVTADSAGTAEAEGLVKGVRTVAVKESCGESGGRCLPLSVSTEMIRSESEKIMLDPPQVKPLKIESPVCMEIDFNPGPYFDMLKKEFASLMPGGDTLVINAESVTAAWAEYWQKKLYIQQLLNKGAKQ